MLEDIQAELKRLSADEIEVSLDKEFEPEAGTLVRVASDDSYWHLLPEKFLELLKDLPDGAGAAQIKTAIEERANTVWHGPSPKGSRDT